MAPVTIKWGYCFNGARDKTWNLRPQRLEEADPPTAKLAYTNWKVLVKGGGNERLEQFGTIYPKREWRCLTGTIRQGCWYGLTGSTDAPLVFSRWQAGSVSQSQIELQDISETGFSIPVRNSYTQRFNRTSDGQFDVNAWKDGDVTFQRVLQRVEKVVTATASDAQRRTLGELVTLKTQYLSKAHAPLRGNRRKLDFYVFGDNLWGKHQFHMPFTHGLEISKLWYVCSVIGSGPPRIVLDGKLCTRGTGRVDGLKFDLIVWDHATPGRKTLTLNGQQIPFNLDIKGYPTPPEQALPKFLVTPLDNQLRPYSQLVNSEIPRDYRYPYRRDGTRTGGLDRRVLVIHGKELPSIDDMCLESQDGAISYTPLALPDALKARLHQLAHTMRGTSMPDGEEAIIVRANLKRNVQPGRKTIKVEARSAPWRLTFADQRGVIRFFRAGQTPASTEDQLFYSGEVIKAGIMSLSDGIPLHGQRLILSAKAVPIDGFSGPLPPPRPLGELTLQPVPFGSDTSLMRNNTAESAPLLLKIERFDATAQSMQGGALQPRGNEILITVRPGEILQAKIADPYTFGAMPTSARVELEPESIGIWQRTLNDLKDQCNASGDPAADDFEGQPSTVISNIMFTQGGRRRIEVSNGNHAALIILRYEIVLASARANEAFEARYIDVPDPLAAAAQFLEDAKQNPSSSRQSFWKSREAEFSIGIFPKVEFRRTLSRFLQPGSVETLAETLGESLEATRVILNKEIKRHIKLQYDATELAIERAESTSACKVDDLLLIAGNRSSHIVNAILPRLVVRRAGRWEPDYTARSHVRSVYILGNAVKDQSTYAALDDAVAASALGLAGSAISSAASLSAYMTSGTGFAANAARLTLALDAADIGLFGTRSVMADVNNRGDYTMMMGLEPVLGTGAVDDARARVGNPWMTLIGIVAPAASARESLRGLRDIRNINRGRSIVRANGGLQSLDGLDDADLAGVIAYHSHLQRARLSGQSSDVVYDQARLNTLFASSERIAQAPEAAAALNAMNGRPEPTIPTDLDAPAGPSTGGTPSSDPAPPSAADASTAGTSSPDASSPPPVPDDGFSAPPTGQCESTDPAALRSQIADFNPEATLAVPPRQPGPDLDETIAVVRRPVPDDADLMDTIVSNPNSTDPSEIGTVVLPPRQPAVTPKPVRARNREPVDIFGNPYGMRIKDRGITQEQLDAIRRKIARGEKVTEADLLDHIDAQGVKRVETWRKNRLEKKAEQKARAAENKGSE